MTTKQIEKALKAHGIDYEVNDDCIIAHSWYRDRDGLFYKGSEDLTGCSVQELKEYLGY